MAAHSPALSPRLPSPPPIPEDQLGPASPGVALFEDSGKFSGGGNLVDTGAGRRIRPGTKAEDIAEGPELVELADIDSAFPLTEHLAALHAHHTHPASDPSHTIPLSPSLAAALALPPPHTSRDIWLYELARFLIQRTNTIIIALFADDPPCSPATCSEMRASEWQYLCAVHDPPKSCAAIDYCCHTLDWAAGVLSSSKTFPSRLGLGSQGGGGGGGGVGAQGQDKVLQHQLREITNIFRRVYRIYAHAWFQHREMFWRVEGKTGVYGLFRRVCDEYGLIQAENYTIPREAEGEGPMGVAGKGEWRDGEGGQEQQRMQAPFTQILARPGGDAGGGGGDEAGQQRTAEDEVLAAGNTTKRHRHTKSDLGKSITPVIQEEAEEEEEGPHAGGDRESARPVETEDVQPLQKKAEEMRNFAESLPQPGWLAQQHRVVEDHGGAGVGGEGEAIESGEKLVEKTAAEGGEETVADEDDLEGLMGVRRSDTVKPPPPAPAPAGPESHEGEGEAEGKSEEGEQTLPEPGEAGTSVLGAQEEDKAVEVMEPTHSPAADAEEAGKSVAD
ncbi:hypothetical protein LTR82_003136 [Friedmanniomyces endolithicus]|uniref:Mob1/phocein n=1 Tax=Friedmanniomyces endolithicus TaxID=329885 RepID=A0AAN6JDG3_9PEZI|nr:hypothetical protein LTR82_003136 [Friedmanniomyces endolithicus]